MSKHLRKQDILGGRIKVPKAKDGGPNAFTHRKYNAKADIEKYGLVPVEQINIKNPITGEKKTVTLRRDGTNEARLAEVMADPRLTRERKDTEVAMYLFERGKESASFLMDIIQYKGQHAKETRVFKDQVRRDIDIFTDIFVMFMRDVSDRITKGLQLEIVTHEGKQVVMNEFYARTGRQPEFLDLFELLSDLALYFKQTSDLMAIRMTEETERREKEKGRGIYVDVKGGVYNIYQDGPELIKRLEADILSAKSEKHE